MFGLIAGGVAVVAGLGLMGFIRGENARRRKEHDELACRDKEVA